MKGFRDFTYVYIENTKQRCIINFTPYGRRDVLGLGAGHLNDEDFWTNKYYIVDDTILNIKYRVGQI